MFVMCWRAPIVDSSPAMAHSPPGLPVPAPAILWDAKCPCLAVGPTDELQAMSWAVTTKVLKKNQAPAVLQSSVPLMVTG